jgi:hypothetical protein
MDKIGLQELICVGVSSIKSRLRRNPDIKSGIVDHDSQVSVLLDRLTQLGTILLEHRVTEVWDCFVEGFVDIYRTLLPTRQYYDHVPIPTARVLVTVVQRIFILGAYGVSHKRFEPLTTLVLQKPDSQDDYYYWLTHAGVMAARAELSDAFRGRSMIGPMSDAVRERPEFFGLFDENMDNVVNAMCQFDFLQCLLIAHATKNPDQSYPNFGGYWNERTLPLVRELVTGGPARQALGAITDHELAYLLEQLDQLAGREFFRVNGWRTRSWIYPEITAFLERNRVA